MLEWVDAANQEPPEGQDLLIRISDHRCGGYHIKFLIVYAVRREGDYYLLQSTLPRLRMDRNRRVTHWCAVTPPKVAPSQETGQLWREEVTLFKQTGGGAPECLNAM
jgi:hypothetical protein